MRAVGIICYALVLTGVGFFVGLRHGEIAKEDTKTPRARGIIVRSLISWFIIVVGGGMITLFFWSFLSGTPRR